MRQQPFDFGYHSGKELLKPRAKANRIWPSSAGGDDMGHKRRTAVVMAVGLVIAGVATAATSAGAHERRLIHPPIHVATPTGGSPITPYVFVYGSHYRYNSPGPVYARLDYWGPSDSCRVWRYNYLYWVC
jgi:hypothetical protein